MSMTLSGLSCGAKGNVSIAPCNSVEKFVVFQHHNTAHAMYMKLMKYGAQICGNCGRWHPGEDGDAPSCQQKLS